MCVGSESLVEIPEGCLGNVGSRFAATVLFEEHVRGDGSAENVVWEAKCLTGIATNLRIPSSRGRIVVEWPPQYR